MSLVLRNVRHRYADVEAIADASLDVAAGEIVCLFGASGCGKTTLLRLVAGLERLQSGTIELDGILLSGEEIEVPTERRPTGFVFQDYVLFPHLSAVENVGFGLASLPSAARRARAIEEMKATNLQCLENRFPHELSGGEQQRVALARALVRRPRAMLLDEPFASVDSVLRRRLREDIRRRLKEYGAATILVTHDPEEALALGDRIAIMKLGKILETASPEDLYKAPSTPEGASLFAGAQAFEGACRGGVVRTSFGDIPAPEMAPGRVTVVALAVYLPMIEMMQNIG